MHSDIDDWSSKEALNLFLSHSWVNVNGEKARDIEKMTVETNILIIRFSVHAT
jgi:hypothetical protein